MKREIKFRGICKSDNTFPYPNEGQFVYGDLVHNALYRCGKEMDAIYNDENREVKLMTVDSNTIGQFTGLTDKHEVKIFEGDVVQWDKDCKRYVVEYRQGMFYANVEPFNKGIYGGFPLWVLCEDEQHCSVVGNIHEQSITSL